MRRSSSLLNSSRFACLTGVVHATGSHRQPDQAGGFISREVAQAEVDARKRPGQVTIVDSRAAIADQQALARAYTEAWGYAGWQGWLAQDPARSVSPYLSRNRFVKRGPPVEVVGLGVGRGGVGE
jgi:hypothetical protein